MCSREVCKIEDLDSKVTESLEKTNRKLYTLFARMTDLKEDYEVSRLEEFDEEVENIWKSLERTNQKIDALLVRLTDIKKDLQNAKTSAKF